MGKASDAELAAFVTPLHAALEECVGIVTTDREQGRLAVIRRKESLDDDV